MLKNSDQLRQFVAAFHYKTPPFHAGQSEALIFGGDRREYALLMEQGTGKSWVVIVRAAMLRHFEDISRLLIIAPSGVHRDWIEDGAEPSQLNQHWPSHMAKRSLVYRSGAGLRRTKEYKAFCAPGADMRIASINIEAIRTKKGFDFCKAFLQSSSSMCALDESSDIKTPSSLQSKRAEAIGKYAKFRMIATGTEVTQGPMDFYAQFRFLGNGLLDAPNYAAFKARYAEWDKKIIQRGDKKWEFESLKTYKNLEALKVHVARHSFQIMKKDCLNIPNKIYRVRSVELSPETRAAYDTVRTRLLAEFAEGTLTTLHPLTRMTRLCQIAGGFWTLDENDNSEGTPIPGNNNKLNALMEEVEDLRNETQFIVWARYLPELRAIASLLNKKGISTAHYWGDFSQEDRAAQADDFKAGNRRAMVAQQQAGGKGHTWVVAKAVYFYSNSFSYEYRKQPEDRSHRIGQNDHCTYTDIIARDTFDEKIFRALKAKEDVAMFFKDSTIGSLLG